MCFPLHLSLFTRKQRSRRLQQAYASGALLSVEAPGQFNGQTPPGPSQQVDQTPTSRTGRRDHSRSTRCGLSLGLLAPAEDARPHPAPLRGLVSSAFSGALAPPSGLFLSEGALGLGASEPGLPAVPASACIVDTALCTGVPVREHRSNIF